MRNIIENFYITLVVVLIMLPTVVNGKNKLLKSESMLQTGASEIDLTPDSSLLPFQPTHETYPYVRSYVIIP